MGFIMVFANYVEYGEGALILELRPAHREYMKKLIDNGRAVAAGSFPDNSGGLYLYAVESQAAAEQLMTDDPFFIGGAIADYRITHWEIHGVNPALLRISI